MRSAPVPAEQNQAQGWRWVLMLGATGCPFFAPGRGYIPRCIKIAAASSAQCVLSSRLLRSCVPVAADRWPLVPALPCGHLLSPCPHCPGPRRWPGVTESTSLCPASSRAASSALDCLSLFIAQREEHGEGLYVISEKDKMP